MWRKKITAIFIGGSIPKTYSNLELNEFGDVKGYGFRLPDGGILLISRYQRNINNPLKGWLFKIE